MKKTITLAAVTALAGLSLSASAWWGAPYGYPYWGGYAPAAVAPLASTSEEQLKDVSNPWGYGAYGPWGHDPFVSGPGDFLSDPFMPPMYREMFKRSDAEREQSRKASEARREAFRARTEAQRAAMDARRQAWRESARSFDYSPYGYGMPYSAPTKRTSPTPAAAPETAQAEQPAAAVQAPAAVPAEAPAAPAPQPMAAAPAPAAPAAQ